MKEEILHELKTKAGEFVSGEELSSKLNVSRTAIWKYINQLKTAGYLIEAQTKKGYKLIKSPDSLIPEELNQLLKTEFIGRNINYLEQLDSTNLYAKRTAETDFEDGTIVIAEEQTKGKGRLGRTWVSPKGKGIWMTIMLKPQINPADAAKVTLLAACAVSRAIENTCGIYPKIKWPNDIVINGKKLCGILTEMSAELDEINYILVGIGINANLGIEDIPEELQPMATSIKIEKGYPVNRKYLTAEIINNFEAYYKAFIETGSIKEFIKEYKEKSAVLGKKVNIKSSTIELQGTVIDITEEGALLVRLDSGELKEIISGEVSVRSLQGYI